MNGKWRLGWLACCVAAVVGCGERPSGEVEGPEFPSDPAAQSAYRFIEAVLAGDPSRASDHLTPLALERIQQSGKEFAPPGLETASFRIGQVRQPSDSQALVQCFLNDSSPDGKSRQEEICCLMRQVDGRWCVSGIAYTANPNRPPIILDFENPRGPVARQPMAGGQPQDPGAAAGRRSPRTALDPSRYPRQ